MVTKCSAFSPIVSSVGVHVGSSVNIFIYFCEQKWDKCCFCSSQVFMKTEPVSSGVFNGFQFMQLICIVSTEHMFFLSLIQTEEPNVHWLPVKMLVSIMIPGWERRDQSSVTTENLQHFQIYYIYVQLLIMLHQVFIVF